MYIYRSNITCPDLSGCFPDTEQFSVGYHHVILRDKDFDRQCGYISHDEAAILWEIARRVGGEWMEIGGHTGWSGAHMATAPGVSRLLTMEPRLRERAFFERWYRNTERVRNLAPNMALVQPFTARSDEYAPCGDRDLFDGGFIDGDHASPMPYHDAQLLLARLKPEGVIVFHDFVGGPVQDGVRYLIDSGLRCCFYDTPQMVAVCWRGNGFEPPVHVPDPAHATAFRERREAMKGFCSHEK